MHVEKHPFWHLILIKNNDYQREINMLHVYFFKFLLGNNIHGKSEHRITEVDLRQ